MNQYFAKMKELSENPKKASSRIRFALKDVIELREVSQHLVLLRPILRRLVLLLTCLTVIRQHQQLLMEINS